MKRALVTGGSGALGRAIALRLASAGHHVVIQAYLHADVAELVAADIRRQGGSAEAVQFDVADPDATGAALTRLLQDGPI